MDQFKIEQNLFFARWQKRASESARNNAITFINMAIDQPEKEQGLVDASAYEERRAEMAEKQCGHYLRQIIEHFKNEQPCAAP